MTAASGTLRIFMFRYTTVRHSTTMADYEIFYRSVGRISDSAKSLHIIVMQHIDISTSPDGHFDRIYNMSSLLTSTCQMLKAMYVCCRKCGI